MYTFSVEEERRLIEEGVISKLTELNDICEYSLYTTMSKDRYCLMGGLLLYFIRNLVLFYHNVYVFLRVLRKES